MKKNVRNIRSIGFYVILVALFLLMVYGLRETLSGKQSLTLRDFQKLLDQDQVVSVGITQNKEVPTGMLTILDMDGGTQTLYVSDVVAIQKLLENYEVKVLGVKLVNLKGTGDLIHPTSSTGETFSWDNYTPWPTANLTNLKSYMNKAGGKPTTETAATSRVSQAITLDGTATDITFGNSPMLVLPQTLTAASLIDPATTGAYLSVLVQIKTKQIIYEANGSIRFQAGEIIYPRPKTAESMDYLNSGADPTAATTAAAAVGSFGFAAVPVNTVLKPGYKYTYTINFFAPNGGGCGWVDPNPTNTDFQYTNVYDPDVDLNPGVRNPTDPAKPYDKHSATTDPKYNPEYNVKDPTYYDGTTKVAPTDNLKPGDEIINSDRPIYFTVTVDGWIDTNPDVYM